MACRGSTDERSMRYLRFRIIADRAELSEASHACSRLTGFFGTEKTERLTRWCGASEAFPAFSYICDRTDNLHLHLAAR